MIQHQKCVAIKLNINIFCSPISFPIKFNTFLFILRLVTEDLWSTVLNRDYSLIARYELQEN